MIETVYATPEMVAAVDGPQRMTVRALAVLQDGELRGVAGYTVEAGRAVVFSKIIGKLPAVTIVRVAKKVIAMAEESGLPVAAMPDPDIPGSKQFLQYLGFSFNEGGLTWPG